MTLKAAIVYVQGSSGNLLARALSLSETTVPYVPAVMAKQQHNIALPAAERFKIYQNWNSENWVKTESELALWYRHGLADFVDFQQTTLNTIAQFHPAEFVFENSRKVLWESIDDWQHIIFIDWQPSSLSKIKKLAQHKRPDLQHLGQIEAAEINAYNKLRELIPQGYVVHWEDMLALDSFLTIIQSLSALLQINDIDFNLISLLWQKWNKETIKLEEHYYDQ